MNSVVKTFLRLFIYISAGVVPAQNPNVPPGVHIGDPSAHHGTALDELDEARACLLYGHVRVQTIAGDNGALCQVPYADMAAYKYLDFGNGADSISVKIARSVNPSEISVKLHDSRSQEIGTIKVPGNGDGKTWKVFTAKINRPKGVYPQWPGFNGQRRRNYEGGLAKVYQ